MTLDAQLSRARQHVARRRGRLNWTRNLRRLEGNVLIPSEHTIMHRLANEVRERMRGDA